MTTNFPSLAGVEQWCLDSAWEIINRADEAKGLDNLCAMDLAKIIASHAPTSLSTPGGAEGSKE